jgi:hypothetical protein
VEAFARAAAGDWETIDNISALATAHMLKIKTLYIYFPDDLLTVLTKSRLQYFLTCLGRSDAAERLPGAIGPIAPYSLPLGTFPSYAAGQHTSCPSFFT